MAQKLLHRYISAHARVFVHLLWWVWHSLDRCLEHQCIRGMYAAQVSIDTSVYICKHTLRRVCTCACVCAFCSLAVGDEGGGNQLVYSKHLLLVLKVSAGMKKV